MEDKVYNIYGGHMGKKQKKIDNNYLPGCDIRASELRSVVEEIEDLIEERRIINSRIKESKENAQSLGFDPKVLNELMRIRSMDTSKKMVIDELLPYYLKALEDSKGDLQMKMLYYRANDGTIMDVANGEISTKC